MARRLVDFAIVVGVRRIVPRERHAGLGQRMTQQAVMNACRLHDDEVSTGMQACHIGSDRIGLIVDAMVLTACLIKKVQPLL
ncbi:hypothetical protein [Mesorhizobium sp. M1143]|uniref:hypothetical protein n=1 Tax=Mesorhizobium sp. M1143 TaxID=2957061 RepID=UPI003336C38B